MKFATTLEIDFTLEDINNAIARGLKEDQGIDLQQYGDVTFAWNVDVHPGDNPPELAGLKLVCRD